MIRLSFAAASLAVLTALNPALAGQNENTPKPQPDGASNRLMIINGNAGHVIHDDGRDDLFCVTRRQFAGWYYGKPVYRRTMSCR